MAFHWRSDRPVAIESKSCCSGAPPAGESVVVAQRKVFQWRGFLA
jgi:hypothetical protein